MTDYTNYQAVTNQDGDDLVPVNYHKQKDGQRDNHATARQSDHASASAGKPHTLVIEPPHHEQTLQELEDQVRAQPQPAQQSQGATAAVDLVRQKVDQLYGDASASQAEADKAQAAANPAVTRSKHQQYMDALKSSGKSLAEIQTDWHNYYVQLSDAEKHEVWKEFYDASSQQSPAAAQPAAATRPAQPQPSPIQPAQPVNSTNPLIAAANYGGAAPQSAANRHVVTPKPHSSNPLAVHSVQQPAQQHLPPKVKAELLRNINKRNKLLKPKQQIQSLLFGLACGAVAIVVVLFSFFNEVIIAPFIQPSRTVNDTPIIIGTNGVAPTDKPEVIIPKINVEIPLDYSAKSIKEADIQNGLENGVVHYPTTPLPGQKGNTAFFGHSSNNIFNPGKYKFAFVLLHELAPGDTFYLTNNGVAYAYQVIDKKIVEPNNVSILDPVPGRAATATLITCDPPGTTLHRLVVVGEQVSPAADTNTPGGIQKAVDSGVKTLPDNGPTLWERFKKWLH